MLKFSQLDKIEPAKFKWTKLHNQLLKMAVEQFGHNWTFISKDAFKGYPTAGQCKKQWLSFTNKIDALDCNGRLKVRKYKKIPKNLKVNAKICSKDPIVFKQEKIEQSDYLNSIFSELENEEINLNGMLTEATSILEEPKVYYNMHREIEQLVNIQCILWKAGIVSAHTIANYQDSAIHSSEPPFYEESCG